MAKRKVAADLEGQLNLLNFFDIFSDAVSDVPAAPATGMPDIELETAFVPKPELAAEACISEVKVGDTIYWTELGEICSGVVRKVNLCDRGLKAAYQLSQTDTAYSVWKYESELCDPLSYENNLKRAEEERKRHNIYHPDFTKAIRFHSERSKQHKVVNPIWMHNQYAVFPPDEQCNNYVVFEQNGSWQFCRRFPTEKRAVDFFDSCVNDTVERSIYRKEREILSEPNPYTEKRLYEHNGGGWASAGYAKLHLKGEKNYGYS